MTSLDSRVLSFLKSTEFNETEFQNLALEVFKNQIEKIPLYKKFCEEQNKTPGNVNDYREIPPLPTTAFKTGTISTFPSSLAKATFYTSGTSEDERGTHYFQTLDLYETSALRGFELLIPYRADYFFSLIPSKLDAPHSSLAHMVDLFSKRFGKKRSVYAFKNGNVDTSTAIHFLEKVQNEKEPVFIAATTVALADLLSGLATRNLRFQLPKKSFLFETGGNKGRRGVPSTLELMEKAKHYLNISEEFFLGEYGMTEISSPSWGRLKNGKMIYQSPFWAPVRIIHPQTGEEVCVGEEGMIFIFDLANLDSVSSLLTGDWGRRCESGFEVIGRALDRELRGCSLQVQKSIENYSDSNFSLHLIQKIKEKVLGSKPVSKDKIATALSLLTEKWLDPSYEKRKIVEKEIALAQIFSPGSITEGINRTFQALTKGKLVPTESKIDLQVYISAGNLPVTGVFGFYEALLSGAPSLHRISSRGGNLLRYLHEDLQKFAPELSARTSMIETSSSNSDQTKALLKGASYVSVQGDDETVGEISKAAPSSAQILKSGDRFSAVEIQDVKALTNDSYQKIVCDIFIWEQLGCRSPQVIFIRGDSELFLKQLFIAADSRAEIWQRRPNLRSLGALRNQLSIKIKTSKQLYAIETDSPRPELFSLPGVFQIIELKPNESIFSRLGSLSEKLHALSMQYPASIPNLEVLPLGELQSPQF